MTKLFALVSPRQDNQDTANQYHRESLELHYDLLLVAMGNETDEASLMEIGNSEKTLNKFSFVL